MDTMPVAERFVSINGEGCHAGQFSTFLRFPGCDLACSYCDTRWARGKDCPSAEMTVEQILDYVLAQDTPCVTLTGGEPLLQPLLLKLVRRLVEETSCFVEIETNGAQDISAVVALRGELGSDRLGLTMDVKGISSGMSTHMNLANLPLLGAGDCVKFVVGSQEDLDFASRIVSEYGLGRRCPVIFSPVFGQIEPAEIVEYLRESDMRFARVQVQLHKVIWPGVEKGV